MIVPNTAAVLPFLLGALILLGPVSLSPLGRLWIDHLRGRRRDSEALEAMLADVGEFPYALVGCPGGRNGG
jgi:hypothetical protein